MQALAATAGREVLDIVWPADLRAQMLLKCGRLLIREFLRWMKELDVGRLLRNQIILQWQTSNARGRNGVIHIRPTVRHHDGRHMRVAAERIDSYGQAIALRGQD